MEVDNRLLPGETSRGDHLDETGSTDTRVNGIKHQTCITRKEVDGVEHLLGC